MRHCLLIIPCAALAACSSSSSEPVTPPAAATVAVSAAWEGPDTLDAVGATGRLRATVRRGGVIVTDLAVSYGSEDPTIASVNPFTGEVSAVANGTVRVRALAGGAEATRTVVVRQRAAQLRITRAAPSLPLGTSRRLGATTLDRLGQPIREPGTITFGTLTPGVVSVAADGTVTPNAVGSAIVSATLPMGSAAPLVTTASLGVTDERFPTSASVVMLPESFDPAVVRIAVGGSVTWTNGPITHDAIFSGGDAPPDVPRGRNFTATRTFQTAGVFEYVCTLHANMVGRIEVH